MNFPTNRLAISAFSLFFALLVVSCAEKGKVGEEGLDCGDHGAAHDGHCHCDPGYLFNGEACVMPEAIAEVCEEGPVPDTAEEIASDESDASVEDKSHRDACVCPTTDACICDGEIESFGGRDYCAPALHEE